MADFLVIAGIPVAIVATGATERAPTRVGARDRGASGRDGGRVRAEKRVFPFTTARMSQAQWTELRDATPPGVPVFCEGDALPAPGDFLVERSAETRWRRGTASAVVVVTLTLEQA